MKLSDRVRVILTGEIILLCIFLGILEMMHCPQWIIIVSILAQGCFIAGMYFQVHRNIKNLEKVLNSFEQDESGEYELPEKMKGNVWLEKIDRIIEKSTQLQTRKSTAKIFDKQTELTALQSQINPHFLYNTLDSIRGQALIDDNDEIARMVEALASFFRYSISKKGNLVTLRDELANINNYMLIQRYRFNNRFSLEIVIDEEDEAAYDYLVPRLIIQPVVENAIFHGLEERLEGGKVIIEIIVTEKNLLIIVSDNGNGIEADKLKEINARIHSSDMQLLDGSEERYIQTGIALPNIHKRIQLLFGKEYGVHVYSTHGQGTDVEIMVPVDYRREEDWVDEEGTFEDS